MSKGWRNALLLTAGLAAGGYCVYSAFFKKRSDLLPALTEQETFKILVTFLEKLKLQAPQMLNGFNNIKQQIMMHGENIEDRKIMEQYMFPHFKLAYDKANRDVLEEYDVLDEELQDAVETYIRMGNGEIEDVTKQIKLVYREFGGEVTIEGEDEFEDIPGSETRTGDMTLQEVLEIIHLITEKMVDVTKVFISEYVEKHGKPSDNISVAKFNQSLMSAGQTAEQSVFKEAGISSAAFQKSIMKFQTSPEVQQLFMRMQSITHTLIEEAGIDTTLFGVGM